MDPGLRRDDGLRSSAREREALLAVAILMYPGLRRDDEIHLRQPSLNIHVAAGLAGRMPAMLSTD
jgi:hypothetical protein